MKIGIIGGGITGLTTGCLLGLKGHEVVIFEKEKELGGLAAGFREPDWGYSLEKYVHHFFSSDSEVEWLLAKLGILDKLLWGKPRSDTLIKLKSPARSEASQNSSQNGGQAKVKNYKICQLDTPFSLLRFPALSLKEKIRLGLLILELKMTVNYKKFEKVTAYSYLKKKLGREVFDTIWRPLLVGKFGKEAKSITMAWFWARIKKRSKKLGYLEGGLATLVDSLANEILNKGQILVDTKVLGIEGLKEAPSRLSVPDKTSFDRFLGRIRGAGNEVQDLVDIDQEGTVKVVTKNKEFLFDKVIVTCPTSVFLAITNVPGDLALRYSQIKYLAASSLVLICAKKLLNDTYWLNISCDFPFFFFF